MTFLFPYRVEYLGTPADRTVMHAYDFRITLSPEVTKACLGLKPTSEQRERVMQAGRDVLNRMLVETMRYSRPKDEFEKAVHKDQKERIARGQSIHVPYEFYRDTALISGARCNGHASLGCDQNDIKGAYQAEGLIYRGHNVECAEWQFELACVWLQWANTMSGFLGNQTKKKRK